jgi:hypothetical protein
MTRLRSTRGGWLRWTAPLAAAAVVVIVVATGVLLSYVVPGGGSSPAAAPGAGTASPSPRTSPEPSICPTTTPVPTVPTPTVSALTVTQVALASAPDGVRYYADHVASPYSAILRINEHLGGAVISAYVWFAHPAPKENALAVMVHVPTTASLGAGHYEGQYTAVFGLSSGHVISLSADSSLLYFGSTPSDLVRFGLAASQVASVTITQKDAGPVPGTVVTAPGFPYRVWMIAFPGVFNWPSTLTFRNATGKVLASGPYNSDDFGPSCDPIASLDYAPPRDGHAYSFGVGLSTGKSPFDVASVTAVLPDGSQVKGSFYGGVLGRNNPYRMWRVTYPIADANLTVKLIFRNAAGQVVDTLTTVPGKNPYSAPKPWW